MPQLALWESLIGSTVTWTYSADPLRPDHPAMFSVQVLAQRGIVVESAAVHVCSQVTHEEVESLLTESWASYLFGERDDVRRAVGSAHSRWASWAAAHPTY